MHLVRHIGERPVPVVAVKARPLALSLALLADILANDVGDRRPVSRDENVGPSVIVVVEEPAGEAGVRIADTRLLRYVDELRYFALLSGVAEKMILAAHDRYVQILPAVIVVIVGSGALYHPAHLETGLRTHIRECPVDVVDVEPEVRCILGPRHFATYDLIADKQIKQAVVVEIGPDRGLRRIVVEQAGFGGDVREGAIAIVPQQRHGLL